MLEVLFDLGTKKHRLAYWFGHVMICFTRSKLGLYNGYNFLEAILVAVVTIIKMRWRFGVIPGRLRAASCRLQKTSYCVCGRSEDSEGKVIKFKVTRNTR